MPSRHSPASDAPPTNPTTNPTTGALTARLNRLREGPRGDPSPTDPDRRRGQPSTSRQPNGSGPPAASSRPGRSVDPPSPLGELVASLAAGLPAIDLQNDTLLSPAEVTELLPPRRRGRKAHKSTVFRWFTTGYKGLRLPFLQVGHQRCTSINALQSFLAALTAISQFEQGDRSPTFPVASLGSSKRSNRHSRIEEELRRRHGI